MLSRASALSCRSYAWQHTRSTMSRVIIKRLSQYGQMYNYEYLIGRNVFNAWLAYNLLRPHLCLLYICFWFIKTFQWIFEVRRPYPSLRLLLERFISKHGFFKICVDLLANNKRIRHSRFSRVTRILSTWNAFSSVNLLFASDEIFFQILTSAFAINRITDNEYSE